MSNSPNEGEKERLTSEELVDLMPHLPCSNLLEIEFFLKKWEILISTADSYKKLYRCNLCKIILSGFKSVSSHINGKKHLGNMEDVKCWYHPEYTFTKGQLKNASKSTNRKYNDQSESLKKDTTSPKKPDVVSPKKTETKVEATSSNAEGKITKAPDSRQKVNPTQIRLLEKSNDKSKTENEDSSATNQTENQNGSENPDSVERKGFDKQTQEISEKSVNKNKVSQKTDGKLQQKSEYNKNFAKSVQSANKSLNKNGTQSSNAETVKTQTQRETVDKPTDDIYTNNKKPEDNKSMMVLRLVPINKLQKPCHSAGVENTNTTNQQSKTEGTKESAQTEKTLIEKCLSKIESNKEKNNPSTLENIEHKSPKDQINEKDMANKQNEKPVENSVKPSSSNEKVDTSRKFVKNPLASKKNNSMIDHENLQKIPVLDVIVIDDNDDNAIKTITTEPDPPPKKQKISISPSLAKSRSNLVVIPTRVKENPIKSKEKASDEPAFAVKSVTDALANDEIYGFVGVEYVIKICRNAGPPRYECGLCELVLDGQSMQNHLLGYTHRLKFCEKHFPTAIQQFRQYILNVSPDEHYKVMIPVLQKLTVAIEEHHGRSLPFECDDRRYSLGRHRVLTEVFARRHASEQRGPTFTHVVDSKQVDEFILRKDSTTIQSNFNQVLFDGREKEGLNRKPNQDLQRSTYGAPTRFDQNVLPYEMGMPVNTIHPFAGENKFLDDETHKRMVDNFLKANKSGLSQHKSSRLSHYERELRKPESSKRSHSPLRTDFGSKKDSHVSVNIWTSYCRLVDNKLKALTESFQQYRANPESHPSYKNEWLKFWHRRKAELMSMGRDYRTYDFQPDWVPFYNNRINELFDEAFEKLKIEARDELSLPMINDYLVDPKYFVHVQSDNYTPAIKKIPPPVSTAHTNMPILSSQMNIDESFSQNLNKERPVAPFSSVRQPIDTIQTNEIEIRDESTPTVVSVLRLLTALEEYLGSLGPKIVELLSKALQAEKSNQGRAEVLLTEENCTVLETAMEKFKGLVITGILDSPKERALKKAISRVNALLDYTRQIKEKNPSFKQTELANKASEPRASNIDSRINNQKPIQNINDKLKQALQSVSNADDISKVIHLIEEKIAASLKAQGRTDVDRAHLEQLAAVCVLLEKKKREAGNSENRGSTTHSSTLQQPLSDTLQKIVGSISSNSINQGGNKHKEQIQPTAAHLNSQRMFPNISAAKPIETISSHNLQMQGFNPKRNVGELNNFMNKGNQQGNFSNLYSKNNQMWMGGDSNFGANAQSRPWQPQQQQLQRQQKQQQQQQNVAPESGWPQNRSRVWRANEGPSSSNLNSQSAGYHNNFGQGQFRYN